MVLPSSARSGDPFHRVAKGETLATIAAKYKIAAPELRVANDIPRGVRVLPGEKLYIPKPGEMPSSLFNEAERTQIAEARAKYGGKPKKKRSIWKTWTSPPEDYDPATHPFHRVRAGETFESIAKLYGISGAEVAVGNGLATSAKPHQGERLYIARPGELPPSLFTPEQQKFLSKLPPPEKRVDPKANKRQPVFKKVRGRRDDPFHRVRHGENLASIAKIYKLSLAEVAIANELLKASRVHPGERIYIPEPGEMPTFLFSESDRADLAKPLPPEVKKKIVRELKGRFAWPVVTKFPVTSGYGPRWGRMHKGIDIGAPTGVPVTAAAKGTVVYADNQLMGFGNCVIVEHGGGYRTLYAHNDEFEVSKGDTVDQGDVIARVGQTGRATGPHLHFEIRKDSRALDPAEHLPKRG